MSKVSFRARALDSNKPLPLYFEEELPDLSEYVAINRTVPQMPTGMEKEEESESHLQKVMNARQNFKDTSNLVIPIPEASIPVTDHSNIYQKLRSQPQTYIRMPGLGLDEELPDYDLDSEDEEWLSVQSRERPLSPIHFERMMDRLEKGSGNTVLSERDAQVLLKDDEDLVMAVYDYWLAKRLRLSRPLIPSVKNERRDGTSSSNPYLAFRKRTEKMQTRKNRKNDEHAYMHMLKLKRDLARSVTLLELIKEREQRKYDHSLIQAEIFRKRYLLQDWSGSLISSLKPHGTPTSTGRRLSTPDNKWDSKGLIIKGDYFDDGDGIIPISNKSKKKGRKGRLLTPTMLDHESPLATVGLSKSDKELKDGDKVDSVEERIDVEELDGPFTFRRKIHLHYHKVRPFGTWPWDASSSTDDSPDNELSHRCKRYCFSRATINGRHLGFSRRRVGRGGRSIWDFVPESFASDTNAFDDSSHEDGEQQTKENSIVLPSECDTAPSTPSCFSQESKQQPIHKHFVPASPKSTSFVDFEFTYLPFVDPSSYPCPELNKGYSQFAGQTLNDDEEEGVSSFSSLPTSQFTLRPCINLDQVGDHMMGKSPHVTAVVADKASTSMDQLEKESQIQDGHGDELVWKKFRQSQPIPGNSSNGKPLESDHLCGSGSYNSTGSTGAPLSVPSTHLSSLESGGLPIQIHVDNLMHLPKKDAKGMFPNAFSDSSKTLSTPAANAAHQSMNPSYSLSSAAKNTDNTGATPTNQSSTVATKPPQPSKEVVWFKDSPSSIISSMNNNSPRLSKNNRFRSSLPSSIARSVTARFKTEVKSELQPLSSLVSNVSLTLPSISTSSSPSSPLPRPLLSNQHQIVSSLINDPKKLDSFVRDKRHFVAAAAAAAAHSTGSGGSGGVSSTVGILQNNSPNGTTTGLELNHNSSKLPSDAAAERPDIKHTLAARTVVNNHNSSLGESSVLVKLTSGTPPSEVT